MAKAKKKPKPNSLTLDDFVKRPPELTVLTDHPLTADEIEETLADDPFNFRYKLGPVFDILRHPGTKTPAAILISGDWGTGKTSAMRWLEGLLKKWNEKRPKDVQQDDYVMVHPVLFYPWKYHDKEDVWKGLLAEVILNAMNSDADVNTIIEAFKTASLFVGKSVLALASATKIKLSKLEISGEALTKIKDALKDAVYPEQAYLNPYEKALEDWLKKTLSGNNRMVIFIDDLDRCMPEIGLQVLEALKLYLNIPNLIFVLGVDKKVVEKLVIEHYKKLGLVKEKDNDKEETEPEKEDRLQAERKARQYLAKMFQTEVELAPSEKQISDFFEQQMKDIAQRDKRLAESDHQELFRQLILKFARRNPREVKRQLNNALIAGAGTQMIDVKKTEQPPTFEQGLQLYFIREVLKGYTLIAEMINTDLGMRFFSDWSELAIRDKDKLDKPPTDPDEQPHEDKKSLSEKLIAKDAEYQQKKYTQLLSDQDLQALMQISFSEKLAELMAEISPGGPAEQGKLVSLEGAAEIKIEGVGKIRTAEASQDYIIIRDAVARWLNKKPEDIIPADYAKVTKLDLSNTEISDLNLLKGLANLRLLDLHGVPVSDIGALAGLKNLQTLDLYGSQVRDISALSGLTNLQSLGFSDTKVSDMKPLAGLTNLQSLAFSGTKVSDMKPLAGLTNLQRLDLSFTSIENIGFLAKLKNLQGLDLYGTQISDIGVLSALTNLQSLRLSTQVSDIGVLSALTNLRALHLHGTAVGDIGVLAEFKNLRSLDLSGTAVRDISPLSGLANLQSLELHNTRVSDIGPLSGLTELQTLRLYDTLVSDLEPLRSLTNLQVLALGNTRVRDISAMARLTELQRLDLSSLKVRDIGVLAELTKLQKLYLEKAEVSGEQVAELQKALPKLEIIR